MGLGRSAGPASGVGLGANASLFVGALAHSGRWRGCLAESKDQPHTIDALDQITRKLGGLRRAYFTTAADFAARCHRAAIEGRWATTMRFFAGPTLLVIDELGYLPLPAEAAS